MCLVWYVQRPSCATESLNDFHKSCSLCPVFLSCKIVTKPARDPVLSVGLSSAKHSLKQVWFYGSFSFRLLVPHLPLPGQFMTVSEVTETMSICLIHELLSCVLQRNGLVF